MIGFLRGKLVVKRPPEIILDVNGVGYELEAPLSTFYDLPEVGKELTLFTHLHVREDAHRLFAFSSNIERSLFRSLIKVNGVGAKLALTILSGISAEGFARCVMDEDSATLVKLPGIGKKTAERLIVEMKDRLPALDSAEIVGGPVSDERVGKVEGNSAGEAVSALISLGFNPPEASRMVRSIECSDMASEEIIRQALQATVR